MDLKRVKRLEKNCMCSKYALKIKQKLSLMNNKILWEYSLGEFLTSKDFFFPFCRRGGLCGIYFLVVESSSLFRPVAYLYYFSTGNRLYFWIVFRFTEKSTGSFRVPTHYTQFLLLLTSYISMVICQYYLSPYLILFRFLHFLLELFYYAMILLIFHV